MDSAGNLYGTILSPSTYRNGVIFELVNQGGGTYKFEVIYVFKGGQGGSGPAGDLVLFKGNFYGVTVGGGGGNCKDGCGTVYRLNKSGGKWVETVLHAFKFNRVDGYWPWAGVALDSDGNIYGNTFFGGSSWDGVVFKLSRKDGSLDTPESSGSYKETILHTFHGDSSGCQAFSGVVLDSAGNIYGTASGCTPYGGDGKVYQLKRSGSKYGFRVILAFNGANGIDPAEDRLAVDSAGNIYGSASQGGGNGLGTVFKLAAGSFLYTDLHDFQYNGTDGTFPGGVGLDSLGNLYGITGTGGSYADGTVWQIANP
jgi:uncharacterized repeat protein (TIGR03803 family)